MKPPPDPLGRLADHLERHPRQPVPQALAVEVLPALRRLGGNVVARDCALRALARLLAPGATPWAASEVVSRALAWRKRGRSAGDAADELLDTVLSATRPVCSQRKIYAALRSPC